MKKRQIKIDFIKGDTVEVIALDDNFMFRLYEAWKGIEIKSGDKIDSIIKYWLPHNKEKAFDELLLGFNYEDKKYVPFITSPGMMKEENKSRKCEYLFIEENDKEFIDFLRNALSLEMIEKLYTKDSICINKDIIARVSLSLSGSIKIDYNPNIVILPSDTYKHTAKYVTIKDGKLTEPKDVEKCFEFADGCGFMSNKMAEIIQKQMELEYKVDFAGIRMYNGLATKGLVVRADWNKYFDKNYKYVEGIFEKRADGYYTLDYFGNMVNISKADLILNTNMCKFAKLWKDEDFNDINEIINNKIDSGNYKYYKDILGSLYVTKVNKISPKEYTQISYQVLNNLALLIKELEEIQKASEEYIKKVSNVDDLRYIKLFMGDIARDGLEELSSSTKIQRLLQIDDKYITTGTVRKTVARLIHSKAHEVVCEPFVKGNFKTASIDPICYLNWIMTRNIEDSRELKEGQFFVPNEFGKRVLTRNPLAVFSEIHRIELTSSKKLDEYFGDLTNELIFFNQSDNTAFVSSGQDFDLDINGVWDNDILYNAVIEPKDGVHFNYEGEGLTVETKWSKANEYESVLMASGNLIGSISNVTTIISNYAQELGYILSNSKSVFRYSDLRKGWLNKENNKELKKKLDKAEERLEKNEYDLKEGYYKNKEEILEWIDGNKKAIKKINTEIDVLFKSALEKLIEESKIIDVTTLPNEEIRQIIINQFYELREIAYEALMHSQCAIDAPKTLKFPTKDDMVNLKEWKKHKKPRFMYFSKFTENKDAIEVKWEDTAWNRSALNVNAKRIYSEIIKPIKEMKKEVDKKSDNNYRIKTLLNEIAIENEDVSAIIKKVKSNYNLSVEKLRAIKDKEEHKAKKSVRDYDLIMIIRDLITKYSANEVAYALVKNNCTAEFIISFCWDIVEVAISSKERYVTIFKENKKGEVDWLFKKYTEVATTLKEGKLQDDYIKQLERQGRFTEFNIGGLTNEVSVSENTILKIIESEYINKKGEVKVNHEVFVDDIKLGFIYPNTIKSELKDSYIVKNAELVIKGDSKYLKMKIV